MAPFLITPLKDKIEVTAGEAVRYECTIGGSPAPSVIWSKRGEEIVASKEDGIEIFNEGNVYILLLSSSIDDDAAPYSLVASNRMGKVLSKSELIVKCNLKNLINFKNLKKS